MKKRFLAAALALTVVLSSGVYAGEQKTEDAKTEAAQEETAEAEEEAEETADAEEEAKEETEDTADAEEETKEDAEETADTEEETKEDAEEKEEKPYRLIEETDLEKYVTLGEYMGMSLENPETEVTEEMVDSEISYELSSMLEVVTDENVELAVGHIANINYVGKKDGEAFDGGTADNYDLEIGSGMFIEGFEDQMVGMKKGETRDLNLTFPEEYPSEDLAGADVVFTVTLNSIKQVPEFSDEWVKENSDCETMDEYRELVKADLEAQAEEQQYNSLLSLAFSTLIENSEVKEFPEKELEASKEEFDTQVDAMAAQYGVDRAGFLEMQGMTEEDYEEERKQYAEYRLTQLLVIQALLDAEGLTFEGSYAESVKLSMAQILGASTFDEIVEFYGEVESYNSLGAQMAAEYILEHAEIKNAGEEDAEETEEAEEIDDTEIIEEEVEEIGDTEAVEEEPKE